MMHSSHNRTITATTAAKAIATASVLIALPEPASASMPGSVPPKGLPLSRTLVAAAWDDVLEAVAATSDGVLLSKTMLVGTSDPLGWGTTVLVAKTMVVRSLEVLELSEALVVAGALVVVVLEGGGGWVVVVLDGGGGACVVVVDGVGAAAYELLDWLSSSS